MESYKTVNKKESLRFIMNVCGSAASRMRLLYGDEVMRQVPMWGMAGAICHDLLKLCNEVRTA